MTADVSGVARKSRMSVGPSVKFVVARNRRALAFMTATAFAGGAAEALFLVTVTRAAFAVTEGKEQVGIVAGWFLSVNLTLLVAFGFVMVRIAAAVWATWQSALLSNRVVARLRKRVARAFLDAEWEVQQGQQAGSLQEFVVGYSSPGSQSDERIECWIRRVRQPHRDARYRYGGRSARRGGDDRVRVRARFATQSASGRRQTARQRQSDRRDADGNSSERGVATGYGTTRVPRARPCNRSTLATHRPV